MPHFLTALCVFLVSDYDFRSSLNEEDQRMDSPDTVFNCIIVIHGVKGLNY